MLVQVRDGDRLERARADVEYEVEGVVAAGLQRRQELGREVQAGGRRGGRSGRGRIRVDGLVARSVVSRREAAILAGFDDVRRERKFADAVGQLADGLAGGQREAYAVFAVLGLDRDGVTAVDREAGRIRGPLARAQHAPPFERVGRRA